MYETVKVIAMDLDGTLTQHKTPLSPGHRAILSQLSEKYKLLMVGAGQVMRIFNQLGQRCAADCRCSTVSCVFNLVNGIVRQGDAQVDRVCGSAETVCFRFIGSRFVE